MLEPIHSHRTPAYFNAKFGLSVPEKAQLDIKFAEQIAVYVERLAEGSKGFNISAMVAEDLQKQIREYFAPSNELLEKITGINYAELAYPGL